MRIALFNFFFSFLLYFVCMYALPHQLLISTAFSGCPRANRILAYYLLFDTVVHEIRKGVHLSEYHRLCIQSLSYQSHTRLVRRLWTSSDPCCVPPALFPTQAPLIAVSIEPPLGTDVCNCNLSSPISSFLTQSVLKGARFDLEFVIRKRNNKCACCAACERILVSPVPTFGVNVRFFLLYLLCTSSCFCFWTKLVIVF